MPTPVTFDTLYISGYACPKNRENIIDLGLCEKEEAEKQPWTIKKNSNGLFAILNGKLALKIVDRNVPKLEFIDPSTKNNDKYTL